MNEVLMNAAVNGEGPQMEHMKPWKRVLVIVLSVLLAALLSAAGFIFLKGMPVTGAPRPEDVRSVTVKYGEEPGGGVEYTDPEKIKLACNLMNALNYKPFTEASQADEIIVTITYNMEDGSRKVAAANGQTGWWRGKALALKQENEFVNLAQGVFPQSNS